MEVLLQTQGFIESHPLLIVLMVLWVLPWKGYALWTAARLGQRNWFIIILILNTLAILDIIYIFFVARKYQDKLAEEDKEGESGHNMHDTEDL